MAESGKGDAVSRRKNEKAKKKHERFLPILDVGKVLICPVSEQTLETFNDIKGYCKTELIRTKHYPNGKKHEQKLIKQLIPDKRDEFISLLKGDGFNCQFDGDYVLLTRRRELYPNAPEYR